MSSLKIWIIDCQLSFHLPHTYNFFLLRYSVEFSKPTKQKPIPEGTVKVLFDIIQMDGVEYEVEFNFENESLKHKLDNTMRTNMFQVCN